jgi:hypothetical protein
MVEACTRVLPQASAARSQVEVSMKGEACATGDVKMEPERRKQKRERDETSSVKLH